MSKQKIVFIITITLLLTFTSTTMAEEILIPIMSVLDSMGVKDKLERFQ